MRKFASFSFSCEVTDASREERQQAVMATLEHWIASKGKEDEAGRFVMKDGPASLRRNTVTSTLGVVHELELTQPTQQGEFRTSIGIAVGKKELAVHASLWGGSDTLAPTYFEAHCPLVIRKVLGLPYGWAYGPTPVQVAPRRFKAAEGGDAFADLLWSKERLLPVVAISEELNGALLHPELPKQMADQLASLAIVAHLDGKASWRMSQQRGKIWSCYNGAIRLYWPRMEQYNDFMQHPLWSAYRLMEDARDTEHAGRRIMSQLRRMIFSQSAFAVLEPDLFDMLRKEARKEEVAAQLQHAKSAEDFQKLAVDYAAEVDRLKEDVQKQKRHIRDLEEQVTQLNVALQYKDADTDGLAPDDQSQPETVAEAVVQARSRFKADLLFGTDVDRGIETLAADAGPPEKVLDYLEILAEMTKAMNGEGLGKSIWLWLQDWGVNGSDEEAAARNQKAHRNSRSWNNGKGERTYFDKHLKPADGTSPDRCVRIYFEYDKDIGKTVVGWVGRHPD